MRPSAVHLSDYEAAAARTINVRLTDEQRLTDAATGLAEEAGEVLGLIRKHLFMAHPLDRERVGKELGDVLWCLAVTARACGLSLEQVAEANLAKLRARYPDGYSDAASRERRD